MDLGQEEKQSYTLITFHENWWEYFNLPFLIAESIKSSKSTTKTSIQGSRWKSMVNAVARQVSQVCEQFLFICRFFLGIHTHRGFSHFQFLLNHIYNNDIVYIGNMKSDFLER